MKSPSREIAFALWSALALAGCAKDADPAAAIDLEGGPAVRTIAREVLEGAPSPANSSVRLINSGNCVLHYSVAKSTTDGAAWFDVTPPSGTVTPGQQPSPELTVSFSTQTLPPNTYTGSISITGECRGAGGTRLARGSPAVVVVSVTVRPGTAEIATSSPIVTADSASEPPLAAWRRGATPPARLYFPDLAFAGGYVVAHKWPEGMLGRYDPFSDQWSGAAASPIGCLRFTGAGARAICLGEESSSFRVATYDPALNQWSAVGPARSNGGSPLNSPDTVLWAGDQLVLPNRYLSYVPSTSTWGTLPEAPAGVAQRTGVAVAWTGTEILFWGGHETTGARRPMQDGAALNLAAGTWRTIPPAPISARAFATATWTGHRLFVWGGWADFSAATLQPLGDGALYDPIRRTWTAVSAFPGVGARGLPASVWTGRYVLVYGGSTTDGGFQNESNQGFLFDPFAAPGSGLVRLTPIPLAPSAYSHWVVWAGGVLVAVDRPGDIFVLE